VPESSTSSTVAGASADPLSSGVSKHCGWVEETSRRTVAISSTATFATTFYRVGGAWASMSDSQSLDMGSTAAPAMSPVRFTQAWVLPKVVCTSSLIVMLLTGGMITVVARTSLQKTHWLPEYGRRFLANGWGWHGLSGSHRWWRQHDSE